MTLVREIGLRSTLGLIGMTGCVPLSSALNVPFGFFMLIWSPVAEFVKHTLSAGHVLHPSA